MTPFLADFNEKMQVKAPKKQNAGHFLMQHVVFLDWGGEKRFHSLVYFTSP